MVLRYLSPCNELYYNRIFYSVVVQAVDYKYRFLDATQGGLVVCMTHVCLLIPLYKLGVDNKLSQYKESH